MFPSFHLYSFLNFYPSSWFYILLSYFFPSFPSFFRSSSVPISFAHPSLISFFSLFFSFLSRFFILVFLYVFVLIEFILSLVLVSKWRYKVILEGNNQPFTHGTALVFTLTHTNKSYKSYTAFETYRHCTS